MHFCTSDFDFLFMLWKFCIRSWTIFTCLLLVLILECICSSNGFANIVCNGVCRSIFLEHGSLCRFSYKNRNPKTSYFNLFLKGVWIKVSVQADRCSVRAVVGSAATGPWTHQRQGPGGQRGASQSPVAQLQDRCTAILQKGQARGRPLSLDTPDPGPRGRVGDGEVPQSWQFLWSQGTFRRSPSPGETVWPETVTIKSRLACLPA